MTDKIFFEDLCDAFELEHAICGSEVLAEAAWWDSMNMLIFISIMDSRYHRPIDIDTLANARTANDLYSLATRDD